MARGAAARHLARLAKYATQSAQNGRSISTGSGSTGLKPKPHDAFGPSTTAAATLSHTRHKALAAIQPQMQIIPEIQVDAYGAVSPVSEEQYREGVYRNVDGHRCG